MRRQELEASLQGHGTLFRHAARGLRQNYFREEKSRQKHTHSSYPTSYPKTWPQANPESLYIVAGIIVKGEDLAEGIIPTNASEIISLTNIINLCLITQSPHENSHYQKFQTRWQEARNKKFQDLWQRVLNRYHH